MEICEEAGKFYVRIISRNHLHPTGVEQCKKFKNINNALCFARDYPYDLPIVHIDNHIFEAALFTKHSIFKKKSFCFGSEQSVNITFDN